MTEGAAARIESVPFAESLGERYLSYALSTIMARSLPDARDGLKPVHRRLLHAMRELRLDADGGFKKCARVVGDVIGKFHPHGEAAVYDAMVRLAQGFAVRYPLVDGQGNFGNIDGDRAAAMRYTEARLTPVAEALLADIDRGTVDFRDNYDGSESEPEVLPAAFPNLLANGASGIAVGMACAIPPHNAHELCDALLHLIDSPGADAAALAEFVPGPDLPTGGELVEPRESVVAAYAAGRGSFRLRARWRREELGRGQFRIVVHELPWQVPKARLIERVAEAMAARKLPWLADVIDESAEDVRVVLVPRSRAVDAAALMESLFRATELEVRVPLNLNVLDSRNRPRVMPLAEALRAFLDHRREVLERRSRHRLERIARRLAVLEAHMVAFVNLDEVVRIVREEDDPKAAMMARWPLDDAQAEAILNMRLRNLRRLEELAIRREADALAAERGALDALLADAAAQWRAVGAEIADIRARFGKDTPEGRRRTVIGAPPEDGAAPAPMVEREPITVLCSEKGWIRAVRGHLAEDAEARFKEGDREWRRVHAHSTDRLLAFATDGRFYTLDCERLPGGRGFGEPLRQSIDLPAGHAPVALLVHDPERRLLVAASDGRGFVAAEKDVAARTRGGRQVLNLAAPAEACVCAPAAGDRVAVIGENRKMLVFPLADLPEMARGRGVRLQRYREGGLSDAVVFSSAAGLSWRQGSRARTLADVADWEGKRGAAGRAAPRGFPKNNRFG